MRQGEETRKVVAEEPASLFLTWDTQFGRCVYTGVTVVAKEIQEIQHNIPTNKRNKEIQHNIPSNKRNTRDTT